MCNGIVLLVQKGENIESSLKSSPVSSPLPGTAAPKTWPSLQQKPSPLTGSYRSIMSSRGMLEALSAPWSSLLRPTPDWHADGHSPTPCAQGTLHLRQTTSQPEGSAPSPLVIVLWQILTFSRSVWECVCLCECVFHREPCRITTQYQKWLFCSWCKSSFPWPVILSPRQSLSTKGDG